MIRMISLGVGYGGRGGDCTIFEGTETLVIDGYCSETAKKVVSFLKKRKHKAPYLLISHAHYDHYNGIEKIIDDEWFRPKALMCYKSSSLNPNFARAVMEEQKALQRIIDKAKKRGIPVKYIDHGTYRFGDLRMKVARIQPKTAGNSDEYLNDGSICCYFPDLRYLTSGDGSANIGDLCKSKGWKPIFFKIPHHGNNCNQHNARWLKDNGARFCWDNDPSKVITEFLRYGRLRCQQAGIKWLSNNEDLNAIWQNGKCSIYKDGAVYRYECAYKGKTSLHSPRATTVRDVLRDKYGAKDIRVTNLINAGFYPVATQSKANKVVATAKGIMDGSLNYGKGAVRLAKVDSLLGIGYGQLVQDYINVLAGVRKEL